MPRMFPLLLAQAPAVDMSTPFSLVVVIVLVGLGAAWGGAQVQISGLKESLASSEARVGERIGLVEARMTRREEHGSQVDKDISSMGTTLKRVDQNVEQLLQLGRHTSHAPSRSA